LIYDGDWYHQSIVGSLAQQKKDLLWAYKHMRLVKLCDFIRYHEEEIYI